MRGLPTLAVAYLKLSGAWLAYEDSTDAARRAKLERRALAAAAKVEAEFKAQLAAGALKALTQQYRQERLRAVATGLRCKPWSRRALDVQKRMMQGLVDLQRYEARRGVDPDEEKTPANTAA